METEADRLSGASSRWQPWPGRCPATPRSCCWTSPSRAGPAVVEQLFRTFDRLRDRLSIVIVDHNLDLALALSDRTVALERGRIFHDGPSRELAEDLELRRKVLWL